jgi:hypothetical protein
MTHYFYTLGKARNRVNMEQVVKPEEHRPVLFNPLVDLPIDVHLLRVGSSLSRDSNKYYYRLTTPVYLER